MNPRLRMFLAVEHLSPVQDEIHFPPRSSKMQDQRLGLEERTAEVPQPAVQ